MDDDINSSDMEFGPPPTTKAFPRGQASIAQIIENASNDRISSKKTVKELQFGAGAPKTLQAQQLWVQRFEAFRIHSLKQSTANPFTGDDLLRFFDSIIGRVIPGFKGKPAPTTTLVKTGLRVLLSYGTFTYAKSSGFEINKQDGIRLTTWIDDCVKAKRLTKGRWHRRVWLNFTIVSRMTKAWLEHHLIHGTWNWDVTISKHLSILIITSLGCRNGDVTRSRGYKGAEHMQYRHFELMIEGDGEPKLENLRARINVEFSKGKKDVGNDDVDYYLRPLSDSSQHHMCPITMLLIHALRHGLVRGSSIQEILETAAATPDSKVVWLFPHRPIIAAVSHDKNHVLDLDKSATINQPLSTIRQMGIMSNILSRVYVHALRLGTAQDVAHLAPKDGSGYTTNEVRQALNHSNASHQRGVTQHYAGDPTRETFNDRADRQFEHSWGAKFSDISASSIVKAPIGEQELNAWQELNEPGIEHDSQTARHRAQYNIRRERQEKFLQTAVPEKKSKKKAGGVEMSDQKKGKDKADGVELSDKHIKTSPTTTHSHAAQKASTLQTGSWESVDVSQIDPRLLDESMLNSMEIDAGDFEALKTQVFSTHTAEEDVSNDDEMNTMTKAVFDDADVHTAGDETQSNTAIDFIVKYSTINVVNKSSFSIAWKSYMHGASFEESVGKVSAIGNSRDQPTPMQLNCTKTPMCHYSTIDSSNLKAHESHCTEKNVARELLTLQVQAGEPLQCSWDDCTEEFLTRQKLNRHIAYFHEFESRPCPHGCKPDKVYDDKDVLSAHLERHHSTRYPTLCRVPGCSSEIKYASDTYRRHLTRDHKLTTTAARAPYFPEPARTKKEWEATTCPMEGCENSRKFTRVYGLRDHIMRTHGHDKETALAIAAGDCAQNSVNEIESKGKKRSLEEAHDSGDEEREGSAASQKKCKL